MLVVSNVIAAAAVACYTLVQRSSEVWCASHFPALAASSRSVN